MPTLGDDSGLAGGIPQRVEPPAATPAPEPPPPAPPPPPPPAPTSMQPPTITYDIPSAYGGSETVTAPPPAADGTLPDVVTEAIAAAAAEIAAAAAGGGQQPPPATDPDTRAAVLPVEDGPELPAGERGLQAAAAGVLRGRAFVEATWQQAEFYNLDPLALFANALDEGASGAVGDGGHAYGPWQIWATDGRLRRFAGLPLYSPTVNAWAWSADGIDYACRSMVAGGAAGLRGNAAVHAIVWGFEKPADKAGEYQDRIVIYAQLQARGGGVRAWLAERFPGPSLRSTPTGGTVTVTADQPPDPSGSVETAFADLQRTLVLDWQGYAGTIRDAGRDLGKAVR